MESAMPKKGNTMKCLFTLGIIATMLTFGGVAMAYPTFNGETGMVAMPNALTADNGSFIGAADLLFSNNQNSLKARALYGLSDRSEVGASLASGIVDGVGITAKYRLTDDPGRFTLAGGGSLTLADQDKTALDLYLVGTQAFTVRTDSDNPLLCTFGIHFVDLDNDNTLRPFFGAQLPLSDATRLIAEYQPKGGNIFKDPLTSVVLRHQFTSTWTCQAGLTNATGYGGTLGGTSGTILRPFVGAQFDFTQGR